MKRLLLACAALTLAVAAPSFADDHDNRMSDHHTNVGMDVRHAPPAPAFDFQARPHFRHINRQNVYVLEDNDNRFDADYFRYGGYYYTYSNGFWYRSRSYRGPFRVVRADLVPRQIFSVSTTDYNWRHKPEWAPRMRRGRRY